MLLLAGLIGYGLLQSGLLEDPPTPATVLRIEVEDPISAAATAARQIYGDGTDTVILVGIDALADGVVATGLSGALDAPILFSDARLLSTATREVIQELGAETVVLMGGSASLAPVLARSLEVRLGLEVIRIAGPSRFDTAAAAATAFTREADPARLPEFGLTALIVPADRPSLALEAGALAASESGPLPVLLSQDGQLPAPTLAALDAMQIEHIVVVGGPVEGFDGTSTLVEGGVGAATAAVELRGFQPARIVLVPAGDDARTLVASRLAGIESGAILIAGDEALAWLSSTCGSVAQIVAFGNEAALPQGELDAAVAATTVCEEG